MVGAFLITDETVFGTIASVPQHFSEPPTRKWPLLPGHSEERITDNLESAIGFLFHPGLI